MRKLVLSVAIVFTLFASAPGIRPRPDAGSYASNKKQNDFSIGADLVPRDLVKKMFAADLNRAGYVVIEVGVFPAAGKEVDLFPSDFRLFVGEGSATLRPVDSDTIAGILAGGHDHVHDRASGAHDINTAAGIGIGRGTYTDPTTGRRTSGTVTETTAGVGVGGPAPLPCRGFDCDTSAPPPVVHPSVQNQHSIEQELWQKSLPDGKTTTAVAGYLYFPKPPAKAKKTAWELRYEPASGTTSLPLAR